MPVRIAYNALALRPGGTGVQTYIRELLGAMTHLEGAADLDLCAVVQADALSELPAGIEAKPSAVAAGLLRAIAGLRSLGPADLVHGLDVDLPLRPGAPAVATVHDMTPFDVPWTMSKRKAIGERVLFRNALRRADAIIADSAFTAERIHAVLGHTSTVVHLGTPSDLQPASPEAIDAIRKQHELPPSFVLHVGTLEPRKDVATVAAACERAGVPLVLAGRVPDGLTAPNAARALGYVDRADLAALYGAATATAVASRYEGFGLPPLEAMVCGSPVIAARVSALPEVLGEAAAFARPGDVDDWVTVISEVAADSDRRSALRALGRQRAATLTWAATAEGTAAVYRSLGLDVGPTDRSKP